MPRKNPVIESILTAKPGALSLDSISVNHKVVSMSNFDIHFLFSTQKNPCSLDYRPAARELLPHALQS